MVVPHEHMVAASNPYAIVVCANHLVVIDAHIAGGFCKRGDIAVSNDAATAEIVGQRFIGVSTLNVVVVDEDRAVSGAAASVNINVIFNPAPAGLIDHLVPGNFDTIGRPDTVELGEMNR